MPSSSPSFAKMPEMRSAERRSRGARSAEGPSRFATTAGLRWARAAALAFAASGAPVVAAPVAAAPSAAAPPAAALPAAALPAAGAQSPDPGQRLPLDPQVRRGELDNGLVYFVRQNERPEGRIELRLAVDAGSLLEDSTERGLAHFVEHMAFRGTTNFERDAIVDYLESIGMRFGPDLNAYTGFDETVYMLTVPTDDFAMVETALRILRDWASEVTFDPAEVERERGVVIEEWRGRRGAQARVMDQHLPVMLAGARHAERLPVGTLESLETSTAADIEGFYRRWYRPELMAVVAVGDADPAQIEALIRDLFADLPSAGGAAAERPDFPVPAHSETLFSVVTDPELTMTQVELLYKEGERMGGPRIGTVGEYRDALAARLYTAMLNARFQEITREPESPFLSAAASRGTLVRGSEQYSLAALVAEGEVERGLTALLTESERVSRHGFTATELERARTNLLRGLERAFDERERTNSAAFAAELVDHHLNASPAPGIEVELEVARALLPALDLTEINELARGWMTDENRVVLVTAPEVAAAPPSPDALAGVLASAAALEVEPYVDEVTDAPLVAEVPPLAAITERVYRDEVGLHEWRLDNGVRVLLRPTDFRDDEILLRGWAPGGTSLASDEDFASAAFAGDVVAVSGLGAFGINALQRELAGKAAAAGVALSEREQRVQGTASPRDLETLFQLVWLHFTEPRYDPAPVQALLGQLRAVLANRGADPNAHFADTLQVALSQGHPRSRPISVDFLDEIDPEAAYAFYHDRFGHADGFTFLLVGNIEMEGVEPLVRRYLGNLPIKGAVDAPRDTGVRPPDGVVERTVARGIEPRSQTQLVFHGPWEWEPDRNFALATTVEILRLRLREVLREDLGATYGVQVAQSTHREPEERYTLQIGFGTDPERLEELVEAVFVELAALRDEGPTDDELTRVREIQRRARETSLRQNGFWAAQIEALDSADRPLTDIFALEDRIAALDRDTIRAIVAEAFSEDRYVRVSLVPAPPEG